MTTLDLIKHHNLLVRPSLTGNWRAGVFKGISCHPMSQAYCEDGTEWEGETLEEAVDKCVSALVRGELNPQWTEVRDLTVGLNPPTITS